MRHPIDLWQYSVLHDRHFRLAREEDTRIIPLKIDKSRSHWTNLHHLEGSLQSIQLNFENTKEEHTQFYLKLEIPLNPSNG